MKVIFEILGCMAVCGLMLGVWIQPVYAETIHDFEAIPIDVNVPLLGDGDLIVEVRDIVTDDRTSLDLTPSADVSLRHPWVVADQYLHIVYTATWNTNWGIRIITDNAGYLPGVVPGFTGILGDKIACGEPYDADFDGNGDNDSYSSNDVMDWDDGDEIKSYGGIIEAGELIVAVDDQNPKFRAMLGWQVYTNKVPKPAVPHDTPDFDSGTPDYNGDDWRANWGYVADKSNDVLKTDGTKDPDKTVTDLPVNFDNPTLITSGFIGSGLAQHPVIRVDADGDPVKKASDGKIAVYLAAKWANTDYEADPDDRDGVDFLLPAGNYKAGLYVELIYE